MKGRLLVALAGAGLIVSMAGAVPANAAGKKRPDLVATALSVSPARVMPGKIVKVSDTTRNKGRKAAPASWTRYVLSKNKKFDSRDVRLGDRKVKRLKPGKSSKVSAKKAKKVRIPSSTKPGSYFLLACADGRKKVRESNERNNCRVAKKRLTVAKALWPENGAVQVDVTARVDVKYRSHSQTNTTGFKTLENEDTRLDGKGAGWLLIKNGKPDSLTWVWSSATASGTEVYDAEGQTTSDCRWDAYAKITGSGAVDVRPMGGYTGGQVEFPGSATGPGAEFGLGHKIASKPTPRINCRDENIGNVSPVPTLELRQSWWAKKSNFTVNWSNDFSKVTWRESVENNYQAPNGDAFENKSYQADGVLTLKPMG